MVTNTIKSLLWEVWEFLMTCGVMLLIYLRLLDQNAPVYIRLRAKQYPYSFCQATTNDDASEKMQKIEECLNPECGNDENVVLPSNNSSPTVNLWELRELALSRGGLLNANYRQQAWPRMAGISSSFSKNADVKDSVPDLTRSYSGEGGGTLTHGNLEQQEQEEEQSIREASVDMIRRDAGRSVIFRYLRDDTNNDEGIKNHGKIAPEKATDMLARVLEGTLTREERQQQRKQRPGIATSSSLHYYQGLHDIAGVILHNMDYQEGITTQIMQQISHSHLRDGMRENFGNITWLLSVVLPPLVEKVDPQVHYVLQVSHVDLGNICLPWVITWFTHDLHDPDKAARLVDAFLSGHPLLPVYFAVALIAHPILKQELLQVDCDDPSSSFLLIKKMPLALSLDYGNDQAVNSEEPIVSIQEILDDAISIMNQVPPRSLLDLVDPELYSRPKVLQRASSISLFRAPASWTLMTGCFSTNGWTVTTTNDPMSNDCIFVRAKLASGVPLLMKPTTTNSASLPIASAVLLSPTWGSRRYKKVRRRTVTGRIKRLVRKLMGKKPPAKYKNS